MDEILWHRRESRRPTENTNIVLCAGSLLPTRSQVWQATDTQLNRQVALKILPDAFADDPDRLAPCQCGRKKNGEDRGCS